MKQRKLKRAKPMESIRHNRRRKYRDVIWIPRFRDIPVQYMTDRDRIKFEQENPDDHTLQA